MTKTLRNSILLAFLFLTLCGFDYFWIKMYKGKDFKSAVALKSKKQKEYEQLKRLADTYTVLRDSLKLLNEAYYNQDKILPATEDSKVSFDYFNTLVSNPESNINFTFKAESKKQLEKYLSTNYVLAGDALFYSLYKFLWKLENYKRLYVIQSLNLQEIEKADKPEETPKSYVKYSVMITGFSANEKHGGSEEITDQKTIKTISHNPFLPLVKEKLPPNTENLLVVGEATLQGLTDESAFIVDSKGNMKVMRVDDKVYLGYLLKIDRKNSQVEFVLNKGGFKETVVLTLKKSK